MMAATSGSPVVAIIVLGAFAVFAVWFARFARRPTAETLGGVSSSGPTMELRPEPPALAGAIVNRGISPAGAVPATVLDLAARGHLELFEVGPDQTVVRRPAAPAGSTDALRGYEQRFIAALASSETSARGLLMDDYITRLDFGVAASLEFERSVHGELLAAGLLERRGGFVSWESLTPAGREAAAHWLGVREFLSGDDSFHRLPPAAVAIWDRYLAYAAAFGIAEAATAPIVAAFAARLPSAADIDAARSNAAAYLVGDVAFDAAEFGIGPTAPFGPGGAYPVDLRGLLAGWVAEWADVSRGVAPRVGWAAAFSARVQDIIGTAPAEVAPDVQLLVGALVSGAGSGLPAGPLDWAFTNCHPAVQRLFADSVARAGADGTAEIRRWNVLRHLALHRD